MHELLLYGQVPAPRHEQVLKILAGVAAMQPCRLLERHVLYKPQREPGEPGSHLRRGGTQAVAAKPTKPTKHAAAKDLYFTQLVQTLSRHDVGRQQSPPQQLSAHLEPDTRPQWSVEFCDVPDTGDRGVSVRITSTTDLTSGDPHQYMVAAGPSQFVSEYYVEGHRFVYGNVVVLLHQVLHEPRIRSFQSSPKPDPPPFDTLRPLDPSGAYTLEAKIRLQDFNNPAVLEVGVGELKRFQELMKSCVELWVPDRLSLDSRVKYRPRHVPLKHAQPGRGLTWASS